MLTLIPFDDGRVVGARIAGKITRPEFDQMAAAMEAAMAQYPRIRLYVELESFAGVALDALFRDLHFGLQHWRQVERKVVVTDRNWVARLGNLSDRLFPSVQVKVFANDEQPQARAWICADD